MKNIYVISNIELVRKSNIVFLKKINSNEKKKLPLKNIDHILCFNGYTFNNEVINILKK